MTLHFRQRPKQATRLAAALAALLLVALPVQAAEDAQRGIDLIGVNLSGAGFAPHVVPGKNGTHYFYPEKKHFAYYRQQGIRLIRFPFLWERVQHRQGEGLNFDQVRLLKKTLDLAMQHDQKVILDMHNYGRYQGELIGSAAVPYAAYADVWRKLAERFKDHPALYGYDIMNEPHGTVGLWPGAAQAAVDAIREVDGQTLIFIEGERWASAYHWPLVNANLLIDDPAGRIVYEAHLYFDEDFSGKYLPGKSRKIDPMLGVARARPFVEWLQKHGQKGFLGEYGIPDDNPEAAVAMDNLLAYLNQHCIPSAYWAGGPGWGRYKLAVEPRKGQDRPQMALMRKHLANDCTAIGPAPANRP
ncbi:glycoside hydrolase family 5 protein [Pseudomonas sp.]|uniref:glycoside hydrolase family 5 protein n=1 Tax=Pseudomonas sp. TaxID=306 RepID=UPI0006B8DB28|nr:glycoside hydrolase family 5 protein [Pseudomonas sp.]